MTELTPLLIENAGLCLLGLALVPTLWILTVYRARIASVGAAIRRQTDAPFNPEPRPAPPAVSVVVVAGDDATALESLLEKLLEQEYSAETEIIVVNDGKNDEIKDVVTRVKHLRHVPNLYVTFTPERLRNVSHRKLAISLGVKASHNPVIILLTEQSRLFSTQWLARMAAPFANPATEVVIGSAIPAVKKDSGLGARYRSFMHGADATEWIAAALRGKTWRGHRANLAFRRDLFFSSGGFNGALNLRGGDDDIFVSRMCNKSNTEVVVAAQAHVRYNHPSSKREFLTERPARYYTSRGLGKSERLIYGTSSVMNWLLFLICAGVIATGIIARDWLLVSLASLLLLSVWTVMALTWRATLKALRCRPALLLTPLRILRRPLTNFHHRLTSKRRRADYHVF